jgi:uncharacterized damage-inducible protein DinB
MIEAMLDAWRIHNINLLSLLDAINDEALSGKPQGMNGRSVGEIFAHIHNIRLAWIEPNQPIAMASLSKIPAKTKADKAAITIKLLRTALLSSAEAMKTALIKGFEKGKISGFKPHAAAFYSYLIAHEWYHIGEICMTLTQAGHPLPDNVLYGLWEWDKT